MGVKGLQFYLEVCCKSASPTVDIAELAEEYRRQYNLYNQNLVIVVDGSSCIRHLYGDLEWIGGGQLTQFGEKAKFFVDQFAALGISLVFFFDGPTVEEKRRTWVERRIAKLSSMYFVLDRIEKGGQSYTINREKHFLLPPGMGQLSRVIFEIICNCKVYQSLVECDQEIATYAKDKMVFAILGQDSDYVIYDKGQALYLSMGSLNLEQMTTRMYDHQELARMLKIPTSHLPLLATFMGNDIIHAQDLRPFHHGMVKRPNIDCRVLVPRLAAYIRSLPRNLGRLYDMTSELSIKLFGTPDRAEDIWKSLHSYQSSPPKDYDQKERRRQDHWNNLVSEARRQHQTNKFPSMVYAIMNGLPFESSTSIEDFRKTDLPSFASATEVIRRRVYGILLQEKPLEPGQTQHQVPEWCMAGPDSLNEANYVSAIPPKSAHPGLLSLWDKNRKDLSKVRWELFVYSVSQNLDVSMVRSLPLNLIIPTLILFYFKELNCLEQWEIDAMLATAASLRHYNVGKLENLPADPLTTRGIRVANLIMRSTYILYILLAACGYPISISNSSPWKFFDGKLFQSKYNQAKNRCSHDRLCDNRNDVLEHFHMARLVVVDNL